MQLPRVLARFNRRVTNPIQRAWAGVLPGHGIIEHTGRKSGRSYRTPVNVFRTADGFAVWIGYGVGSDWVRNLLAADGGRIVHRGHTYVVTEPHILTGGAGLAHLPWVYRVVGKRVRADSVLCARIVSD